MPSINSLYILLILLFQVSLANGECDRCYNQTPAQVKDSICLVIDRSGSMSGKAINNAKQGAMGFVDRMSNNTSMAVISFSNTVDLVQGFTSDQATLKKAISSIQAGGNTALNDAVAYASLKLQPRNGRKMIVFLTDGRDNRSQYGFSDIRGMNISEGIFVYGIGLGDVNKKSLSNLCAATGGIAEYTASSKLLLSIYQKMIESYYISGTTRLRTGAMVIRSLPDNQPVYISETYMGRTPLVLHDMKTGSYKVRVNFDQGSSMCIAQVKALAKTSMDLRPPILGRDLIIKTRQAFCPVFVDGVYMGSSGYKKRIHLSAIPSGKHLIKLICMPDFDYGPEQVMEIPISITAGKEPAEIRVNILKQSLLKKTKVSTRFKPRKNNPFAQLEQETESF